MSQLASRVLPVFRSPQNERWDAGWVVGAGLYRAVDVLQSAAQGGQAAQAYEVTTQAIAAIRKVCAKERDPAGVMSDVCWRLLELHASSAAQADVDTGALITWLMKFHFGAGGGDFLLDPADYAPALGEAGMARYRELLRKQRSHIVTDSDASREVAATILDWQEQRLAVWDRDADAVVRTHARDLASSDHLLATAVALAEIGEDELAVMWARRATYVDLGSQARQAGDYWCALLEQRGGEELLDARLAVVRRWPDLQAASLFFTDAGPAWPDYQQEVIRRLSDDPATAVEFALNVQCDVPLAWELAHDLDLEDDDLWVELAGEYMSIDALAVLPVYARLVNIILLDAQPRSYRVAAQILNLMRRIAQGTDQQAHVDATIANLREAYVRRPLMLRAFDKEGLNRPLRVPRQAPEPSSQLMLDWG